MTVSNTRDSPIKFPHKDHEIRSGSGKRSNKLPAALIEFNHALFFRSGAGETVAHPEGAHNAARARARSGLFAEARYLRAGIASSIENRNRPTHAAAARVYIEDGRHARARVHRLARSLARRARNCSVSAFLTRGNGTDQLQYTSATAAAAARGHYVTSVAAYVDTALGGPLMNLFLCSGYTCCGPTRAWGKDFYRGG